MGSRREAPRLGHNPGPSLPESPSFLHSHQKADKGGEWFSDWAAGLPLEAGKLQAGKGLRHELCQPLRLEPGVSSLPEVAYPV